MILSAITHRVIAPMVEQFITAEQTQKKALSVILPVTLLETMQNMVMEGLYLMVLEVIRGQQIKAAQLVILQAILLVIVPGLAELLQTMNMGK